MDTQNIMNETNTNSTEDVTQSAKPSEVHRMTKEECQQKSDVELLLMVQQAQGHTGEDFSDHMKCDFSYSYLTNVLKKRGYQNGWYKPTGDAAAPSKPTVIKMKKSEDVTTRRTYMLGQSVAEEWRLFNQNVPYPTVTLEHAMRRFIADYKAGLIKFELEI